MEEGKFSVQKETQNLRFGAPKGISRIEKEKKEKKINLMGQV
jgi:hypothetical protein